MSKYEKNNLKGKNFIKQFLAFALSVALFVTLAPESLLQTMGIETKAEASTTLSAPRIVTDSSMKAGQKVTWDCVWFGSYPQTEIVDQPSTSGCYGKDWEADGDYEVNASLYTKLEKAAYDSNGDTIIANTKYRRIKKSDATYGTSDNGYYYNWTSSDMYHYFRYEPIKWRVLDVNGSQALLLADITLDHQKYNNNTETDVSWETSTVRSWLNGYESSSNISSIDYSSKNFIGIAFNSNENNAILSTYVVNDDNISSGTEGGNTTKDKVFFLSESEVYNTDTAYLYGFVKNGDLYDEARKSKSSPFAKAMGIRSDLETSYLGNCKWWMRSPGNYTNYATYVKDDGQVIYFGWTVYSRDIGCRPALNLNLSSSNLYAYAGTVCSDGTVSEPSYSVTYDANGGSGAPSSQAKKYGISLNISNTVPTRSGYKFMGWSASSTATSATYTAGSEYNGNSNLTLYAVWKGTYTLTYDANGGTGAPPERQISIANAASVSLSGLTPTRTGYTFKGWSKSKTATTASYAVGDTITMDNDLTLYAVWSKNSSSGSSSGASSKPAVTKASQTITASNKTVAYKSSSTKIIAKTSGDGKLSYCTSSSSIATVSSNGTITAKKYGSVTITITAAETNTYKKASKKITVTVVPKKLSFKSFKKKGVGKLKATWKKDKSVSGYTVQMSKKKNFKKLVYNKNYSMKKTSCILKGLKKYKNYYIRIRSYKTVGGKKLYGSWSSATVKIW